MPFQYAEDCFKSSDVIKFWVALTKEPYGKWYNPYDPSEDIGEHPDVFDSPTYNCMQVTGGVKQVFSCGDVNSCGMCNIPSDQIYYLKGTCKSDRLKLYDFKFYINGIRNKRPYFQ